MAAGDDSAVSFKDAAGATHQHDTRLQANGDERPVTVLGDPTATTVTGVRPDGFLNVRADPTTLLFDTFEAVDTVDTWTVGGTVTATASQGVLNMSAGTAANATTRAQSKASFTPGSNAFLQNADLVQIEAAPVTGVTRWWGLGIPNATPTTTAPITNGVIFETAAADGLLYGRCYSNGALSQSVPLTRPTDGGVHRYQVLYRTSRVYFNIDGVEVGSIGFPNPGVGALPASVGAVNGGAALGTAPVFAVTLVGVGDTGRNGSQVSDPRFPWREARVTAAGELLVTDTYRTKQAVGIVNSGRLTVQAAADAATAGRIWLINPVGSAVLIEVRRVEMSAAPTAVTAFPSAPRITIERMTFTGTATGAVLAPSVRDTAEPALVGSVRTASAGLTPTAGAVAYGFLIPPVLTGVGVAVPSLQEWEPAEAGRLVLRPGQGIVVRQPDAATAADTRMYQINIGWAEFTNPA